MLHELPKVYGEYVFNFPLKDLSFLGVGGVCDVLFRPKNYDDLACFLRNKPNELEITVLGNLSNVLILDGGIRGCVITLPKSLDDAIFLQNKLIAGAGVILTQLIRRCLELNISCCEKLIGIPGTLGGAIAMNAGIPDFEISDVLESVTGIDFNGHNLVFAKDDINMQYRDGCIPEGVVIISATLKTHHKTEKEIMKDIDSVLLKRKNSQPIGQKTCGSTFKNPIGIKAWQLIKAANCDKLRIGDAAVSDVHCNFLVNLGNAKALDFLCLIKMIKEKVFEKTEVLLEEEVVIIGENL
ncbi:MAG: UDP-N-acetylmuramate dehydrogenase [Holosporales bacterium]|jgi:UDP-N-acetylmuramate dehydrogenase|nr:UDP-N-acetylmuramate dehydrogenase [Holosporales bacterium]